MVSLALLAKKTCVSTASDTNDANDNPENDRITLRVMQAFGR